MHPVRNTNRLDDPIKKNVKSGINPLFTKKRLDNILKVCYNKYNEMKERNNVMKKILAVLVLVVLMVALIGCGNRDMIDTVYSYEEAVLSMADGTIVRGKVENWRDYEDGEQIQVKIDGVTYLVNSVNVTLIHK